MYSAPKFYVQYLCEPSPYDQRHNWYSAPGPQCEDCNRVPHLPSAIYSPAVFLCSGSAFSNLGTRA